MSTNHQLFVKSLAGVGVETKRVRSEGVATAIEEFRVGNTVAVPFEREDITLPEAVTTDPTPADLRAARTGVTPAAFAIADYGSVVLPSTSDGSELVGLFVDRHIVLVDDNDIVADMEYAVDRFDRDVTGIYDSAIIATGPSATADMGALVRGAHGPSEVRVVVVED